MTSVNRNIRFWVWECTVWSTRTLDDHLPMPTMASTYRVQLAVYDSPCLSHHLSPFENKIGGYPVSLHISSKYHALSMIEYPIL